jgi:hypothetical protein
MVCTPQLTEPLFLVRTAWYVGPVRALSPVMGRRIQHAVVSVKDQWYLWCF